LWPTNPAKGILIALANNPIIRLNRRIFDMAVPDWLAYLTAAKSALDIIKGIRAELPKGPEADKAQQQIDEAEAALKTTKAQLAKSLGFRLCKCSFPPSIMLLRKEERAYSCPECGDRFPPHQQQVPDYEDEYISVRR
jgi:hypothetical protein